MLENINGISDVEVSHVQGTAKITVTHEVDMDTVITVIEADGYKVTSII